MNRRRVVESRGNHQRLVVVGRHARVAALSLALLAGVDRCDAGESTDGAARLTDVMFPSTAGWTLLEQTQTLTEAEFAQVREKLRASFRSARLDRCDDGSGCSAIDRMLDGSELKHWHTLDADADGHLDIVYSGPAQCAEGDVMIIWFGTKDGFVESMRAIESNARLLRIAPGHETAVSSVAIGCCGDPVDEYSIGTLENPRRYGVVRTTKTTHTPHRVLISPVPFTNRGETVLRSTTEKDERYDPDLSGLMDSAVFGNILCRYLKGAAGVIRVEERDQLGRVWVYVVMDSESRLLRHDAPFNVDAGWVEKSTIRDRRNVPHAPEGH